MNPPQRIGKYEILAKIGRGGFAVVYKARDPALDREIALKVLKPEHVQADRVQRFLTEARQAARLTHPGIVPIYEVAAEDGQPYIAMAYLPGGSLLQRLAVRSLLPTTMTLRILEEVAGALTYAHEKKLLHECDVHTLLRLPTGIFYAQGVKANVLFFDKRAGRETAATETLWVYDLRTNQNFTLKQNPLAAADLEDFIRCYHPQNRHERTATWSAANPDGRWWAFTYEELLARDKVNLDIFWLRDESLEESANLPDPDVIAVSMVEDLEAALEQLRAIVEDLEG